MVGISSYNDGCNICTCEESGITACTEMGCSEYTDSFCTECATGYEVHKETNQCEAILSMFSIEHFSIEFSTAILINFSIALSLNFAISYR